MYRARGRGENRDEICQIVLKGTKNVVLFSTLEEYVYRKIYNLNGKSRILKYFIKDIKLISSIWEEIKEEVIFPEKDEMKCFKRYRKCENLKSH